MMLSEEDFARIKKITYEKIQKCLEILMGSTPGPETDISAGSAAGALGLLVRDVICRQGPEYHGYVEASRVIAMLVAMPGDGEFQEETDVRRMFSELRDIRARALYAVQNPQGSA
jgi:hypothetical protein